MKSFRRSSLRGPLSARGLILAGGLLVLGLAALPAAAEEYSYSIPPTNGETSRQITVTVNGDDVRYVERFGADGQTFGNGVSLAVSFNRHLVNVCNTGLNQFKVLTLSLGSTTEKTFVTSDTDGYHWKTPGQFYGMTMKVGEQRHLAWLQKELCASAGTTADADMPNPTVTTEDGIGGAARYLVFKNNSKSRTMRVTSYSIFGCKNVSIGCGDTAPMQTLRPGESRAIATVMAEDTDQPIIFDYKYETDWPK